MELVAQSNASLTTLAGDLSLYAESNVTVGASNDVAVTAMNDFGLYADASASITAAGSNLTLLFDAAANDASLQAANDISLSASNDFLSVANSNVAISALKGGLDATAHDSNMFLKLDAANDVATLYGLEKTAILSSNAVELVAQSNMSLTTLAGDLSLYAESNVNITGVGSNSFVRLTDGDLTMYALSNVALTASNALDITSTSDMLLQASNMTMLSHSNIAMTALYNVAVSGSNDVTITAASNLTLSAANIITETTNDASFRAQSNINFYINAASNPAESVFVVSDDKILIHGDMVISGSISTNNILSTTVIQDTLKVEDKEIVLANVGSNFDAGDGPFDGLPNTGAGIRVDGVPSGFDTTIPHAYDKLFAWNHGPGNGILDMGTGTGMSDESYWEMKGGSFRMTHQKIVAAGGSNVVRDVSFGFRVNEFDELELVKKHFYSASNDYVFRRIARFGRILE